MAEISVIVPVYNSEKTLRRCVDSILAQTFTGFELILVDDGSSDNSGFICDDYAAKDPGVRVIHKKNGGVSSARNAGLDCACGRYIMFCDSDDYVSAYWCETMYNAACQYPDAFICHDLTRVGFDSNQKTKQQQKKACMEEVTFYEIYKLGISAYTVNKIYDSKILKRNNLRFDEAIHFGEDAIFNAKYCGLCRECIHIPHELYYYVQFPDSMMHRYHPNRMEWHLPIFMCRLPLISESDIPEYCDIWLYQFLQLFNNVFDPRNAMTFFQRLQYNQRMMQTKEVRYCVRNASGKNERPLVLNILRINNYYVFWLFNKLVNMKQKLRRK